jgi:hypothetical protein
MMFGERLPPMLCGLGTCLALLVLSPAAQAYHTEQ